jgi:hypothetical protein
MEFVSKLRISSEIYVKPMMNCRENCWKYKEDIFSLWIPRSSLVFRHVFTARFAQVAKIAEKRKLKLNILCALCGSAVSKIKVFKLKMSK